jgi:hypothetical protein
MGESQYGRHLSVIRDRGANMLLIGRNMPLVGRTEHAPDWAKYAPGWAKHASERQRNGACEPKRQATRGSQILLSLDLFRPTVQPRTVQPRFAGNLSRFATKVSEQRQRAGWSAEGAFQDSLGRSPRIWIFAGQALKVRLSVI